MLVHTHIYTHTHTHVRTRSCTHMYTRTQAQTGAPCLSFDILPDSLGDNRTTYPMTAYLVSGTQAELGKQNYVILMKMSQLKNTDKDNESKRYKY